MKTRLWFMLGLAATLSLSSCNDEEKMFSNSGLVNAISISSQDFIDGDAGNGTRAAYVVDESGFHFNWSQGDTVGIYPVGGDQVAFPISSGEGSQKAQFDGGAWALRSAYSYAAYYPFSSANYHVDETSIPVSYTGQCQVGNGSVAGLDRYDYQASVATKPDGDGNVNIYMKHLGCFVRFQITMPTADTYKSITLTSSKTPFVISGTFDLTQEEIAIVPAATSASFTVGLSNALTTEEDKVLSIYAMLAPSDLSDSDIAINIEGTTYRSYTATVAGKNMLAGKAYSYSATVKTGTNINGADVAWDDNGQVINYKPDVNGREYVDLGLSVLWATCNLGAIYPEEYGDYFAWGETEVKATYTWSTYKYSYGNSSAITKYCNDSNYGNNSYTDTNFTLEMEDDVAHKLWGGGWRMPTEIEFNELLRAENCSWTWTKQNGKNGFMVTSKKSGYENNSIFLPVAGYRYNTDSRQDVGSEGYYWSSSLYLYYPTRAKFLKLSSSSYKMSEHERFYGLPIRPVCQ